MPLSFQQHSPNGGILVGWHLSETSDELLSKINLSPEDVKRFNSFKIEKRKREWMAVRVLLQLITGKYPTISYLENGKPLLDNYHISISHSSDLAVVAIHPQHPVSVDIEQIEPRVCKVASRFLSSEELANIPNSDEALLWQTIMWCTKEAMFKYWNEPGIDFKQDFHIRPFKPSASTFPIETYFTKNGKTRHLTLIGQYTQSWAMVYLL